MSIIGLYAAQFISWWSEEFSAGLETILTGQSGGTLRWSDRGICGASVNPSSKEWWTWPYPPKAPFISERHSDPLFLPAFASVIRYHNTPSVRAYLSTEMNHRLRTSCGVSLSRFQQGPFVCVRRKQDHQSRAWIVAIVDATGEVRWLPYTGAARLGSFSKATSAEVQELIAARDSGQLPADLMTLDRPNQQDVQAPTNPVTDGSKGVFKALIKAAGIGTAVWAGVRFIL